MIYYKICWRFIGINESFKVGFNMSKFIIDRIESQFVVCEDELGNIINLKKSIINGDLKEGSVIIEIDNKYNIDEEETKKRKEELARLMDGMWANE